MNPETVITAVCTHTGVDRAELMSERRGPRVVMAREVCSYILREHLQMSYIDIARMMKRIPDSVSWRQVPHNTPCEGHKKVRAAMKGDGMRVYRGGGRAEPRYVNVREMIQALEVTLGLAKEAA